MSYIGNTPFTAAFQTDTFSGNGTTTAFTMSVAPANTTSIIVAVTGVVQDPSTYSVSGTTLTFSAAPPTGTSNISVRFLGIPASGVTTTAYRTVTDTTATAGQTTFTIPSYTVGYINVFRNGSLLAGSDYTATTGTTVVLVNAASAGDTITTESFYVSSVLNAIPATTGSVGTTYIADANVTQAKLASGVAGTGPAFSAYASSGQSISNTTFTKLQFQTEEFDTNSCYDNSTNYRFTPTVAGYYQVNGAVGFNFSSNNIGLHIYKNGSRYRDMVVICNSNGVSPSISSLVYLNGSTDYIEMYVYQSSGGSATTINTNTTYGVTFSASMVRGA